MEITVAVPFYNAEKTLLACLGALSEQDQLPGEIILVDNNSTDRSAELVRDFMVQNPDLNIILLQEKMQGPSAARNRAIREASCDVIAFTDSDCIPDRHWLKRLRDGYSSDEIGAVAGRVVGFQPKSAAEKFHSLFTLTGPSEGEIYKEFTLVRGGFPTANFSARKDVLESVKGFDESLETSEDYDLCARLYRAGYYIYYAPEAVVFHQHRNTLAATWRQGFGFGKNHGVLLKRHFERMVILDLPRFHYQSEKWPLRMWLDLQGADKRTIGLVLVAMFWWPLWFLMIPYSLYLFHYVKAKLKKCDLHAGFFDRWQMVALLLAKSSAITAGRIAGSVKERVLCF
ncbi:MAG: glycosyltransferase [Deltaproteobacteria bacterium]|nr:glycosyltransferase [Deltaproteobacteria bacterium]MBW2066215.1 glycosyltransferase [Deltaproteobacteria bacterium]